MNKIIKEIGNYRLVERMDHVMELENLKGECFSPKANPDVSPEELKRDELVFEERVNDLGVYGYTLERWNPAVGVGWEVVDSCWGFVGSYSPNIEEFTHYIVEELLSQIPDSERQASPEYSVVGDNNPEAEPRPFGAYPLKH